MLCLCVQSLPNSLHPQRCLLLKNAPDIGLALFCLSGAVRADLVGGLLKVLDALAALAWHTLPSRLT